jgi:hypothetical protein
MRQREEKTREGMESSDGDGVCSSERESHSQQWDGDERYEDETPSASEELLVRIGRRARALRHARGCARRLWPAVVPRLAQ